MSLYLLIVTIVVPDVTIFIYLLSVRDLTSIFEVPYIIYNVQFLSSSYMKTSLFWTGGYYLVDYWFCICRCHDVQSRQIGF